MGDLHTADLRKSVAEARIARPFFSIVTTLLHEEGKKYGMIKRKERNFCTVFARC